MEAGICDQALTPGDILAARYFPSRVRPRGRWREYYWGEVLTPTIGVNRKHELSYAV